MQEIFNDTEPLKDRLLRNGFRMYLLSFVIAPAWYLIKLMVSRSLSVEDVGLVYSIIWFIWLLSAFNDLGLTEALQYYLPQYLIDKEYSKAKTILVVTRIVQFIGWIIIWWWLYFAAPWMAEYYFNSTQATEILRLFCFYFLFINLFQVLSSVFTALQNIKLQYITEAVRMRTIVFCLGYLFFFDTINLWNFSLLWLISIIIWVFLSTTLFYIFYKEILYKSSIAYDWWVLKTQRSYAWKIMIAMQAGIIYNNIGQQFAISFLGTYEAWIRSNYITFFTIVWSISWPIISYLFPLLTELYKKQENEKIETIKKYLTIWLLFWSIWIGISWWFFAEWAIVFLFGDKFLLSGTLFKRSSLFFYFILGTWVQWNILAWAWYVKERLRIIVIWTFFSLILSYIGIQYIGIRGLAGSLIATHIYFWSHSFYYIKKYKL